MSLHLSQAATAFVERHLPSLLHLEVLLMLSRDSDQWSSPQALGGQLGLAPASIQRVLEELGASNLVDVRIGTNLVYRFAPLEAEVRPVVEELAQARYADREDLEAFFASRRRSSVAARRFADAFRFREPDADA